MLYFTKSKEFLMEGTFQQQPQVQPTIVLMITQQSAKNNQLIKNNKKINILLSAISLDVDKTILTHPLKYSPGFQTGSKVKTSNFPKSE